MEPLRASALDTCIQALFHGKLLEEAIVKQLCLQMKDQLRYQGNIAQVASPVTVVGDIRGCARAASCVSICVMVSALTLVEFCLLACAQTIL